MRIIIISLLTLFSFSCASTEVPPPTDERTLIRADLTGNQPAAIHTTWKSLEEAGIKVRTFEQTHEGATFTRRYLMYLPNNYDSS